MQPQECEIRICIASELSFDCAGEHHRRLLSTSFCGSSIRQQNRKTTLVHTAKAYHHLLLYMVITSIPQSVNQSTVPNDE